MCYISDIKVVSLVVLFNCVILHCFPRLRDTADCSALRAPAILQAFVLRTFSRWENGCVLMSVRVSRIKALLQANLVGLLTLAWYCGLLRTACSRNPSGIRTPRIFPWENGYVLMSVRASRTYPLLQQVEEWVILWDSSITQKSPC